MKEKKEKKESRSNPSQQNRVFCGVVGNGPRRGVRSSAPTNGHNGDVARGGEVVGPQILVFHIIADVAVNCVRRSFSLQLEDNKTRIVTRSKEVLIRVGGQDPEAVVLTPECLNGGPL